MYILQLLFVGVTPLNLAAKNGHEEALLFLLVQTNNVNAHIPTLGCSALHFAAQRGSDRVATELLAAGASVDAPSASTGFTPLMYAASAPVDRAQSTVNLLLDAGASVATIVQTKSQSIRSPLVAFIDAKKFGVSSYHSYFYSYYHNYYRLLSSSLDWGHL